MAALQTLLVLSATSANHIRFQRLAEIEDGNGTVRKARITATLRVGEAQLLVSSKSGGHATGDGGCSDRADKLMTEQIPHTNGLVQTGGDKVHCA